MEDSIEISLTVTTPLENVSEVAQVGYEIKAGRGLLGSVTTVEIGADPDVGGRPEKLTIVVDVIGQSLEVGFGFVGMGGDSSLPTGDDHPYVEGDPNDGAAVDQDLYLFVGELTRIID